MSEHTAEPRNIALIMAARMDLSYWARQCRCLQDALDHAQQELRKADDTLVRLEEEEGGA